MSSTKGASPSELLASNLFGLDGRVALVTGGATGIGLMCAHALAVNGAKVYVVGRREEELKKVADLYTPKSGSGKIIPLPADITSKENVLKLVKEFSAKESALHLLVNNAGVALEEDLKFGNNKNLNFEDAQSVSDHLLRADFRNWQDTYQTNVSAVYFMTAAFLPLLAEGTKTTQGYSSSVVNITSISGIMKTPSSGQFAYAASKGAAIQLTRNLGNTLVGTKVRVNSIAPGVFPSVMTSSDKEDATNKSELDDSEASTPAQRFGSDTDMAASILFLAGKGGVFFNGQIIHPDGGQLLVTPSSM